VSEVHGGARQSDALRESAVREDAMREGAVGDDAMREDAMRGEPRVALKRLSHDVKNALNGISVNLEVARTRAAREPVDLSHVTPFLDNAMQQLELAIKLHKQFADLAVEHIRS
jgi:hypothetical protein